MGSGVELVLVRNLVDLEVTRELDGKVVSVKALPTMNGPR
jgi:hypothetical protein